MSYLSLRSSLLLGSLLLGGTLWAQRVSVQTRLDRPEIRIGEPATVEMTIRTDDLAHTRYHLVLDSTGVERYRVLAFAATDTVDLGDGLQEIQAKLVVTSFDSTLITLPPILVETPSGQALSKPLALNVLSPQVDLAHPDQIKPVEEPWEVHLTWRDYVELLWDWCWPIALALGLLLMGLLLYRYLSSRPKPTLPAEPVRALSLLERYLLQLGPLAAHPLQTQEDFKGYYSELTGLLRRFFGEIYGVDTLELTSEELLRLLQGQGLAAACHQACRELLRAADLVKFAKGLPSDHEAQRHYQQVEQVLRETCAQREATTAEMPQAGKEVAP